LKPISKSSHIEPRALFVGLCTLDIIQLVTHVPAANEKVTGLRQTVAAGGPASNAAVAFAHLGGSATLVSGLGVHPLAAGVRADLKQARVELIDAAASDTSAPPVSSIMVTKSSGERSVVSINAAGRSLTLPTRLSDLVSRAQAILIDGHHPELALAAAQAARAAARVCVLDGGSWKNNTRDLLPYIDIAVCSADFHPPGTSTVRETLDYLGENGVAWAAITQGAGPIAWAGPRVSSEISVPEVKAVDTVGAGDIFHGAFIYAISSVSDIHQAAFVSALESSAATAAYSCQYFGTREWITTGHLNRAT
jgi:sugar/nucleoside kinase (ribokinase family)